MMPPAYNWLGRLRQPMRATFLRILGQALMTDEGRRQVLEALHGGTPQAHPLLPMSDSADQPYPDLGRAPRRRLAAPVFITGRFRSGSTLLWNIFRHVGGCRSYYEPLNERRWFDPEQRRRDTDPTHIGVSDYWREYEGIGHLRAIFKDTWHTRAIAMDEHAWDPELRAYIDGLISAA